MGSTSSTDSIRDRAIAALNACGAMTAAVALGGSADNVPAPGRLVARSPITGGVLGPVVGDTADQAAAAVGRASEVFAAWRLTPAPGRGALIRHVGDLLREYKTELAELVSIEAGKIRSEGLGEVQEMIDICEFAVGLSRQLHGLTIASERPGHRLAETWHPMGPVLVITAFNFPVAVWSWNTALAVIGGNPVIWKPSDKTPLTALACAALFDRAAAEVGAPAHLNQVVLGGRDIGEALVDDERIAVVSATGSTAMGRAVAPRVAARFARSILELGGNNAAIIAPSADLELAVRGIVFSAAGTAGQRCTTLRRVIVHSSIRAQLLDRLATAYGSLPIGDPLADGTLVGPIIDEISYRRMQSSIATAVGDGGRVIVGGERVDMGAKDAFYVQPTIIDMPAQTEVVRSETFAPLLYVLGYDTLDQAIELQNGVPQGLASSIFTTDLREAEWFCSAAGSDCGIANVNIGPSGAEIGGAFGGEKETGGGRESGSDAWKGYMRRQTNTINYSNELPLAQGVEFG